MRKYLKSGLLVLFLFSMGCAGSSPYMRQAEQIAGPSPDKALVYFMRPSGLGFAVHFQIWEDYQLLGLCQAKSFFAYKCAPGKHLFIGRAENKVAVEADLEAGKSYYIITQVRMGGWKARMGFIPVTRGSEFWGQVEIYKNSLNFTTTNDDVIAGWEAKRRDEIRREIDEIKNFLQTPEGQNYIVKLNKEDGR